MNAPSTRSIDRLRTHVAFELDAETVALHLERIEASLLEPVPVPSRRPLSRWRLRALAVMVVALAVVPGLALAADDAVPGDFLYPVKLLTEPVLSLIDSDVSADRRVEELDRLTQVPTPADAIDDAVADAEGAVSHLPDDHPLHQRLEQITDRLHPVISDAQQEQAPGPRSDEPRHARGDKEPAVDPAPTTTLAGTDTRDETSTTTSPPERTDTTTTTAGDSRPDDPPSGGDRGAGDRDG